MSFFNQPLKEAFIDALSEQDQLTAKTLFNKSAKIETMFKTDICRMDESQLSLFFKLLVCPSQQRFKAFLDMLAYYADYMNASWQGSLTGSTVLAIGNQEGYNYKANIFNRFVKDPAHLLKVINVLFGKPQIDGYYIFYSAAIVLIYSGIAPDVVHTLTKQDIDFEQHTVNAHYIEEELWDIIIYALKSTKIPIQRGLIADVECWQLDNIIKYNGQPEQFYHRLRKTLIQLRNNVGFNPNLPMELTVKTVSQSGEWYRVIQQHEEKHQSGYQKHDFNSFKKAYYS